MPTSRLAQLSCQSGPHHALGSRMYRIFFAFLRAGEFTVPTIQGYDPYVHLSLKDVELTAIHLLQWYTCASSKAKQIHYAREGISSWGPQTQVSAQYKRLFASLRYVAPLPGPLFTFQSGSPLTRSSLVSHLQSALSRAGTTPAAFTGHSFRIGAATTAAKRGLEDSLIQTLGRWKNVAYLA